nr:origin recognition complex subunit 1 isoform X1 [Nomia melanderi]
MAIKLNSRSVQSGRKQSSVVSSDEENILESVRYALQGKRIVDDKKYSLKIRLKRSTEQSLYKIDNESECNNSERKKHDDGVLKHKKKKSIVESEDSCSDSKSNDENIEKVDVTKSQWSQKDKVEMYSKSRVRKPPLRLSSYHCGSLEFLNNTETPQVNSPCLRNRKNINYCEEKLNYSIMNSYAQAENRKSKQNNKGMKTSIVKNSSENEPKSNVKNNKRNRLPSLKDTESDSSMDTRVTKTKSMRKSNESQTNENNKLNVSVEGKEITREESLPSTPNRVNKNRRTTNEAVQKNIEIINKTQNDSDEESLVDLYKHIKISSTVKDTTPVKGSRRKRISSESRLKESNDEETSLANMYEHIKIVSGKKHISTPQKKRNIRRNIEAQLEGTPLSTPKSRSLKHNNLTPSMGRRNCTLVKPATPLQEARSRLHVSAVPKSLPCREEEFNNIFTFLKGKLEDKTGGCIYVSGVPGTGKTATVNETVRCLQKLTIKGQLDDFDYVAINGMKLTDPRQSYVQILKQLDGKTATWEQAYRILEKRFHSVNSKMTLLLVDELDFLCTKRQDVVYNLLDWPTKKTAQLIVVTIANTMDLPERVLMGRVTSRLGLTRLTFQPYNYKQLQEIVMSRLRDFSGFRSEAIQLVARKVSAVSGDARRALDICRRAMEIAESRNAETISLQDVTEAVSEMIASPKVQAIKHCSKMEQVFLQAISAEVTRTSIEEVYFKDAYTQFEALCSFDGMKIPTITETLTICGRLGASRLLICEHSRNDIYQKILLNVSTDDIHYAIQELDLN